VIIIESPVSTANKLAVASDAIEAIRDHEIAAGTAGDPVAYPVSGTHDVVAHPSE
jgi:hypothetical protein